MSGEPDIRGRPRTAWPGPGSPSAAGCCTMGDMPSAAPSPAPAESLTVVLAVKALDAAKTRLAPLETTGANRRTLVTSMLADTLDAVRAAGAHRIVVVSPDPTVHDVAAAAGAVWVDEPETVAAGWSTLNGALHHGATGVDGAQTVAYLQADLPALSPASLRAALTAATEALRDGASAAFVADHTGEGTVLLVATTAFAPRFGPESAAAHRAAGAREIDPDRTRWPDLRTDIDTPDDLAAARTLGLGPRTRAERAV